MTNTTQKITPFLWFNDNLEEAVNYYTKIFKDSKIHSMNKMPDGQVFTAEFELLGQKFMGLNGGPMHANFTESVSFFVNVKTQEEVDYYWNALTADGGEESMCGWLKDKFGLSWQIVPDALGELMEDPDQEKAQRVMQAMMKMNKIIISDLENAQKGE
jgi:predicted 3-demethylubiquinone-9 3-methyltransferase (glyoxalase superfamily)